MAKHKACIHAELRRFKLLFPSIPPSTVGMGSALHRAVSMRLTQLCVSTAEQMHPLIMLRGVWIESIMPDHFQC